MPITFRPAAARTASSLGGRFADHCLSRLAALWPSACALCGGAGDPVCRACTAHYFDPWTARCPRCALRLPGHARDAGLLCGQCLQRPPAFDATVVAGDYQAPIDNLVLALKFGKRLALAATLAQLLHQALCARPGFEHPELMTAVPLGRQRLAQRGFNQALEIAKPLAKASAIPLLPRLAQRQRETPAQTLLTPDLRRRNLRHAFMLADDAAERIRGRHVAIVDDVVTTGATVGELAAVLKRGGAARVSVLAFARTPAH